MESDTLLLHPVRHSYRFVSKFGWWLMYHVLAWAMIHCSLSNLNR